MRFLQIRRGQLPGDLGYLKLVDSVLDTSYNKSSSSYGKSPSKRFQTRIPEVRLYGANAAVLHF